MHRWLLLFLLVWTPLARAASPVRSPEKLRSLALLPRVNMSLELSFSGSELSPNTNDWPGIVAQLQRDMENNLGDAERQALLSSYLSESGKTNEARTAALKAVEWFKLRVEARPHDEALQRALASALRQADRWEEAETICRKLVETSPKDWRNWNALGELLNGKVWRPSTGADRTSRPALQESAEEALKAFNRAIELGPDAYSPFVNRAFLRSFTLNRLEKRTPTDAQASLATLKDYTSADVCADWERAARLSPTNFMLIGYWAWMEALDGAAAPSSESFFRNASSQRRAKVVEALGMLETLGERSDRELAAGALETIGILRLVLMQELPEAKAAFRRAVTLAPTRLRGWSGLATVAIQSGNNQELAAVSEERLKYDTSAMAYVFAAKACDRAQSTAKALDYAREALKRDAVHPVPNICLGALLLRQPREVEAARTAIRLLETASKQLEAFPKNDEQRGWFMTTGIDLVIAAALADDVIHSRELLQAMLAMPSADDETKERLREIQTMLGK